jgi:hypothetical protein
MKRSDEIGALSDLELDVVSGGLLAISVESQQRLALQQRLTEIYRSNHPTEIGRDIVFPR